MLHWFAPLTKSEAVGFQMNFYLFSICRPVSKLSSTFKINPLKCFRNIGIIEGFIAKILIATGNGLETAWRQKLPLLRETAFDVAYFLTC